MGFIVEDQHLAYKTLIASNEYTDQKKKVKPRLTFPLVQVTGILLILFKP